MSPSAIFPVHLALDHSMKGNPELELDDPFGLFRSLGSEIEGLYEEGKSEWLRSQIVGSEAEFESPFGMRKITYSDHTASGRFLQFVEDFILRNVLPFYGNTHTGDSYVGLHTTKLVHQSAKYIKKCMGAGPSDALLFCGTGSTAAIKRLQEVMSIAVPSTLRSTILDHLPASNRLVVFVGPYEHHSNLLSWRQSLAQVVEIGLDEFGHIDVDELDNALESSEFNGRPKLGSFSACSNVSGVHTDTRAIARLLHRHGAYACFDFACSGPYAHIDMRSGEVDGYDAVFLSPHKFIGGPGSPGILLMSKALYQIKDSPPSTSGGGTVLFVSGHDKKDVIYCDDLEEREDAGTPAIVQKIRAALAFSVKEWMGHVFIQEKEACLLQRAMERLMINPHVQVLGNTCIDRQPVVSFLVYPEGKTGKHLHCRFVTKLLNDLFGIQARGGCSCAGPYGHILLRIGRAQSKSIKSAVEKGYNGVKPGWTRVSFPYYTATEEMEFLVDAIEFIASHGHRFLPLYNFDWKTGSWEFSDNYDVNASFIQATKIEGRSYADYVDFATRVIDALTVPDQTVRAHIIPECIDPQLVNFMLS